MFDIEDYNYCLPDELIAQEPAPARDGSRLLMVERLKGAFSDHFFNDLPRLLRPGDLLVVNNTRVVPARLFGKKESGGRIEILVLDHDEQEKREPNSRWCLLKSSKRPQIGSRLFFRKHASGTVTDLGEGGRVRISFESNGPLRDFLMENGEMPLPPYIKRGKGHPYFALDRERYQTVYSKPFGAVAAPTAGLHFTPELMKRLEQAGIAMTELTLHVGHGTFRPVRVKDIRGHELGEERYFVDQETAGTVNLAKREGRRVIAVGTTVVRTLESIAGEDGQISPCEGRTGLLITPGHEFRIIDGMITNFHLPKSSLLFLVSAFGGLGLIKRAYERAVEKRYRFFSYGDAMLLL